MGQQEKKVYAAPSLQALGFVGDVTAASNAANSDVTPFVNNTAFGPPTS
jgi:hypothetical protein